jgi:hypothetical protein
MRILKNNSYNLWGGIRGPSPYKQSSNLKNFIKNPPTPTERSDILGGVGDKNILYPGV